MFLFGLMEMNFFGTASNIFKEYVIHAEASEQQPPTNLYYVNFITFNNWLAEENSSDYRLDRVLDSNMSYIQKMKNLAEERQLRLTSSECLILLELLRVFEDVFNNKRYQDPCSCLFITQLKMFNMANRNIGNLSRQKSLRSKEVIWAIHSQQPDGLFDICFPIDVQTNPQFLTWENFRKYCVPLWYDDGMKLKSFVEKIALFQYKQSK
jgi:hypothetical protein